MDGKLLCRSLFDSAKIIITRLPLYNVRLYMSLSFEDLFEFDVVQSCVEETNEPNALNVLVPLTKSGYIIHST